MRFFKSQVLVGHELQHHEEVALAVMLGMPKQRVAWGLVMTLFFKAFVMSSLIYLSC